MPRYSAQFRNTVLRKLLSPESRSVVEVAREYNLSVSTVYGWKVKMNNGTLQVDDGVQSNRNRQLSEKLSLLLEYRSVAEDDQGSWLRDNGLHSEHLTVWEQEVREAMGKGGQRVREELKAARKKIREQERELARRERALAEAAIIITAQKKTQVLFEDRGDD